MYEKLVSVLIITRGRFDSLLKAVDSIINTAKTPKNVEILIRFDNDDRQSLDRLEELPKDIIDINILVGTRYGYEFLHKYVNEICEKSKGEFLAWFNDDCVIESKNWDDIINEYTGKIVCLYPDHKGTGSGNIFPIISSKIFKITGHFSLSQQVDTWQYIVGTRAGIGIKRDDMVFIHNRKQEYISDENRADVLKRTANVWNKCDKQITEDAKKIKRYIREHKKSK